MMDWIFLTTSLWETSAQTFASNLPGEWYTISLLVVTTIAFALILMYMLSKIFQFPQLESTIKRELFQLIATLLMITILLGFEKTTSFAIASGVDLRDMISEKAAEQLLGKQGYQVNVFDASYVYLISTTTCLKKSFEEAQSNEYKEMLTRMSAGVYVFGGNLPLPLSQIFLSTWKDLMTSMMRAEDVMWLSIAAYFQINLLQWIEASMVTVYLPIGILLRSVPFTRGGGAAIMAIAISLYFVYPFLLTTLFFSGPPLPKECKVTIEVEGQPSKTVNAPKVCPSDPTAIEAYYGGESTSGGGGEGSKSLPTLDISGFQVVRLYAFFYPFIAMVGTLLFARSLAQVLGGNISDIGRGMVRVI